MKSCIRCSNEKEYSAFGVNNRNIDGLENTCRECRSKNSKKDYVINKKRISDSNKKSYIKNKGKREDSNKKYYESNKNKILKAQKEYQSNRKDKIKEYQSEYHKINGKEYRIKNKERLKKYSSEYSKNNKEKLNKYNITRSRVRKLNDPLYKLMCSIRSSISNNFKCDGFKKSISTQEILCCSFEEFKLYLESKFESWMTWENKGLYNREFNYGWDMDHIIPLSTAYSEEELIKLNHYTNFQPLCSKINREIKSNKLNYEM